MQKTPSVFLRDPANMSALTDQVDPRCQWVLDGEGVATRKYDGTCVMLDEHGAWWARREVKKDKPEPPNFLRLDEDPHTGKVMGWEPIEQSGYVKAFRDALDHTGPQDDSSQPVYKPGTYELCGPKVNGNPEGYEAHTLVKHSDAEVIRVWTGGEADEDWPDGTVMMTLPQDRAGFATLLADIGEQMGWEGLVWHHPDGRMAKLKVRDFA